MATMEVILATKIEGLGAEADLVTVKAGYGRNYLIPKGLAHEATASNRRFIANLQAARAKREAEGGRQGKRLRGAHPFSGRPGSHLGDRASFCHPFYFPSLNKQGIMPALGVTRPHARHRSIPPPKSTA